MLHKSERDKLVGQHGGEATETEAQAVAEAIGIPDRIGAFAGFRKDAAPDDDGGSLTQTTSMKSDYTSEPNTPSPDGGLSPDSPAPGELHSPTFDDLDSPALSDEEEDEEDEQEGEEDEDNDDEEKGANPGHKVKNTAAVHAARKMEAGEGKYLKPEARFAEETMES